MNKTFFLIALAFAKCSLLSAGTIAVPNGDFNLSTNFASLTSTLGQTRNPMGSTSPWGVKTSPLLGLLAAPTATIASGSASVSNLLGIGVAGQSNSAQFYQTLPGQTFSPFTTYTLSALVVTSSSGLSLSILGNNGIGIALTHIDNLDSDIVADSNTANVSLVSLTPLMGTPTSYTLTLQYVTTASVPGGDLGIRLYAGQNAGLASVNLLGGVSFATIGLASIPEPSTVGLAIAGLCVMGIVARKRQRIRGGL